jgi:hypothetical protein
MLARNHVLAGAICAPDFCLESFERLQQWQRHRLAGSFSDLMARASYRPACDFFLGELYGGLDFLERDRDMDKVMHLMIRFLPDKTLKSLAEAFELQAISLEFDMEMAEVLDSSGVGELDVSAYTSVYQACGQRAKREKQILLIRDLGMDLARLVDKPLVTMLVRLLRGPAHAAGFGTLQEFLETGLFVFRELEDSDFFIETIYAREWLTMQKLFAGDENPFLV